MNSLCGPNSQESGALWDLPDDVENRAEQGAWKCHLKNAMHGVDWKCKYPSTVLY